MGDFISRKKTAEFLTEKLRETDIAEIYKGIVTAVREWVEDVPPEKEWTYCSDRLPEEMEVVLVSTSWDRVTVGELCDVERRFWLLDGGEVNAYDDEVVAWMALPKACEPKDR